MTEPQFAPSAITKAITDYGGMSPTGLPNWRVVLAQTVLCIRGGLFIDRGNEEIEETHLERIRECLCGAGPLLHANHHPKCPFMKYRATRTPSAPKSTRSGILEVPKWPVEGWILERWFPPHYYGSQEEWEAQKGSDGITPMMGPFPTKGDYFLICGPWQECPPLSDFEQAMSQWERQREEMARQDQEGLLMRLVKQYYEHEEKVREKARQAIEDFCMKEVMPVWKSTSLEAQRVRQQAAADAGVLSHVEAG